APAPARRVGARRPGAGAGRPAGEGFDRRGARPAGEVGPLHQGPPQPTSGGVPGDTRARDPPADDDEVEQLLAQTGELITAPAEGDGGGSHRPDSMPWT